MNVYRREIGYIGRKMLNWRKSAAPDVRRDCYPAEQPQPPYSEHSEPLYPKSLVQAGSAPTQLSEPAEPESSPVGPTPSESEGLHPCWRPPAKSWVVMTEETDDLRPYRAPGGENHYSMFLFIK